MARVVERDCGAKVVLTISRGLYRFYQENLELAKSMRMKLEIRESFEKWFAAEQRQIRKELEQLAGSDGE